jgi:hypothetical protein
LDFVPPWDLEFEIQFTNVLFSGLIR